MDFLSLSLSIQSRTACKHSRDAERDWIALCLSGKMIQGTQRIENKLEEVQKRKKSEKSKEPNEHRFLFRFLILDESMGILRKKTEFLFQIYGIPLNDRKIGMISSQFFKEKLELEKRKRRIQKFQKKKFQFISKESIASLNEPEIIYERIPKAHCLNDVLPFGLEDFGKVEENGKEFVENEEAKLKNQLKGKDKGEFPLEIEKSLSEIVERTEKSQNASMYTLTEAIEAFIFNKARKPSAKRSSCGSFQRREIQEEEAIQNTSKKTPKEQIKDSPRVNLPKRHENSERPNELMAIQRIKPIRNVPKAIKIENNDILVKDYACQSKETESPAPNQGNSKGTGSSALLVGDSSPHQSELHLNRIKPSIHPNIQHSLQKRKNKATMVLPSQNNNYNFPPTQRAEALKHRDAHRVNRGTVPILHLANNFDPSYCRTQPIVNAVPESQNSLQVVNYAASFLQSFIISSEMRRTQGSLGDFDPFLMNHSDILRACTMTSRQTDLMSQQREKIAARFTMRRPNESIPRKIKLEKIERPTDQPIQNRQRELPKGQLWRKTIDFIQDFTLEKEMRRLHHFEDPPKIIRKESLLRVNQKERNQKGKRV